MSCTIDKGASIHDVSSEEGRGGKKYPKYADKHDIKFGQRGEGGVKKSEHFADVIYGSPLSVI